MRPGQFNCALGGKLEHPVAHGVSVGIVDFLEMVNVKHRQRKGVPLARAARDLPFHRSEKSGGPTLG
jgi:hypothetical protein